MSFANVRLTLRDSIEQDIKHNNILGDLDTQVVQLEERLTTYIDTGLVNIRTEMNANLVNIRNEISTVRNGVNQLHNEVITVKTDIVNINNEMESVKNNIFTLTDILENVKTYLNALQQTYSIYDNNGSLFEIVF